MYEIKANSDSRMDAYGITDTYRKILDWSSKYQSFEKEETKFELS